MRPDARPRRARSGSHGRRQCPPDLKSQSSRSNRRGGRPAADLAILNQ